MNVYTIIMFTVEFSISNENMVQYWICFWTITGMCCQCIIDILFTIISQGDKEENNYDYEIQPMLLCIYWLHVTSNYFVWQNFLTYSCKDCMACITRGFYKRSTFETGFLSVFFITDL